MPGPVVTSSDRVAFRTPERDDVEFFQRSATDPRLRFPLGSYRHRNREQQRERFEGHVESDGSVAFVVCLQGESDGDPTRIGAVIVHNVEGDRAWLSYWLLPEYHGEGYGGEAAELAVDYTFETHGVHGISAGAYAFNDESRGLLESLGFTADVLEVDRDYLEGEYHDSYTYSLLRHEWDSDRRD